MSATERRLAKPLTRRGLATRTRIVAAAAELIYAHGVKGTTNEQVRKAAGVSGSQLTHYFPDKESLVRAVIAWRADRIIALHRIPALGRLDSGLRPDADPEQLSHLLMAAFQGACCSLRPPAPSNRCVPRSRTGPRRILRHRRQGRRLRGRPGSAWSPAPDLSSSPSCSPGPGMPHHLGVMTLRTP